VGRIDDWQTLLNSGSAVRAQRRFGGIGKAPYNAVFENRGRLFACVQLLRDPGIRGKYRSRTVPEIVEEATWLYEMGARECILVAQDTSYYGRDKGQRLSDLLAELIGRTSFPWIRLMYLHPALIDEGFAPDRLRAAHMPYFDMPLQHGADEILRLMTRVRCPAVFGGSSAISGQ